MNEASLKTRADFILPLNVVSKIDLSRLINEIERVDNELSAVVVRAKTGFGEPAHISASDQLTDFLFKNQLTLESARERTDVLRQLGALKDTAPVLRMTFAVEADPESLQQLAQWARDSVHPHALLAIGLQPALVAGVYLRTPNHVHDLSMRGMLEGQQTMLVKELETLRDNN
jgi:hypothetical protein